MFGWDWLGVSMCRSFIEGLIGFGGIGEGNMFHLSELLVISRNYDDRIIIYKNAIIGFSYFRQCDPSVSREVGTKYCKSIGRSCESLKFWNDFDVVNDFSSDVDLGMMVFHPSEMCGCHFSRYWKWFCLLCYDTMWSSIVVWPSPWEFGFRSITFETMFL